MAGLYIHIPFCATRCSYCGFYSTTKTHLHDRYVDALCREMDLRHGYPNYDKTHDDTCSEINKTIDTIYIGGGTPSQLSPKNFERIFSHIGKTFHCSPQETTVEMNPDDVTPILVSTLCQLGVNRISMGVQTFDDKRLKFLRRRHTSRQVYQAVDIIRAAGITNISIDLMFGFPEETIGDWTNDIRHALSLDAKHISAYSLMYEEGTPLYRMLQQGIIQEVDENTSINMYDLLIELTENAGFEHYEISNFARKGFRARHNSSYWQDAPYIGIGAAAHSYDLNSRQWNVDNIDRYIYSIENGQMPCTVEQIDNNTHYNDIVTTALRTSDGIDLSTLQSQYREFVLEQSDKFIKGELLELHDGHIRLTRRGLYISDMIMSDLMKI